MRANLDIFSFVFGLAIGFLIAVAIYKRATVIDVIRDSQGRITHIIETHDVNVKRVVHEQMG